MQFRAKQYCAGRTRSGRMFVVMEGAETSVDDRDVDMLELVRSWIDAGLAEQTARETPQAPEQSTQEVPKAAVKKAAVSRRTSTKESDQ